MPVTAVLRAFAVIPLLALQEGPDESSLADVAPASSLRSGVHATSVASLLAATGGRAVTDSRGATSIVVPPGTHALGQRYTFTESIEIRGAGPQVSELVWAGTGGGFVLDAGTGTGAARVLFSVHDLSLMTSAASAGRAVEVVSQSGIGTHERTADLWNLEIAGVPASGGYWTEAIHVSGGREMRIRNCELRCVLTGANNTPPAGTTAITLRGGSHPTNHVISENEILFWDRGTRLSETVEGVTITSCTYLACNSGVDWTTSATLPYLNVANCHFDVFNVAASLSRCSDSYFHDNLIYRRGSMANAKGVYIGDGSNNVHLHNNIIRSPTPNPSPGWDGIIVGQAEYISIESNHVINAHTGVWLQSSCSNSVVFDNIFVNSGNQDVVNQGTGNNIRP